jgi:hypothetical protein
MKIKFFIIFITALIIAGSFLLVHQTLAQNPETAGAASIQYPVKELGNCADKKACKAYCDKSEHMEACFDFAGKNNLMSKNEISTAKKFVAAGNKGPGGCKGKDGCETYCNDIDHIDECVAYAEKNDMIPPEKLSEAKKVQAAIKRGVKPPPCKNKEACDSYCEDPNHMEECVTFGIEAGFIQGKELEDSQKMLAAIKKGVKPPRCQGKEECDAYCGQDEHFDECANFAEAAGFMSAEEATMARKTKGKGPGGCKGKDTCEAFCNNPDNQETCFNFAKENGLIPEEDLKRMEEGKQQFKESLNQAPSEVKDCLNSAFGLEMMEKFKSGAAMPPREIGNQMRQCFEKVMPMPPQGTQLQAGPGGCKTPEECEAYCKNNPDECKNFQSGPGAIMMSPQPGPGGCKTPEECKAYCETNPEACKGFQPAPTPGQAGQFEPGAGGPNGPTGQPIPSTGPACDTPEKCQQMQNQMMPNQPLPPKPCEGENCPPPPTSGGMSPGVPGTYTPPAGMNPPLEPQQYVAPPTTSGAGGGATPGDYVPPAPPSGEVTPPPPTTTEPPPPTTSTQNEPGSVWKMFLKKLGF